MGLYVLFLFLFILVWTRDAHPVPYACYVKSCIGTLHGWMCQYEKRRETEAICVFMFDIYHILSPFLLPRILELLGFFTLFSDTPVFPRRSLLLDCTNLTIVITLYK